MTLSKILRPVCVAVAAAAFAALAGCAPYGPNYAGQPYYNNGGYVQSPSVYQSGYNGYAPYQGGQNYYQGDSGGYGGQPMNAQPYYGQYNSYDGYGRPMYQQQQPSYGSRGNCGSALNAGTLIGGAGGALLGSTIGRGKGQLAGVAAGALLGGMAGNSVNNNMNGCN